jgi:hypothetical protein
MKRHGDAVRSQFPISSKFMRPAICAALALLCASCSSIGPKPWEKDLMARAEMKVDPYPLQSAAEDHIYFSREASSGGRGFAGGGCGCN